MSEIDDGGAGGPIPRKTARALVPVIACLAASCGGRGVDFYVHDTGVVVDSTAPFAVRPELAARLESTVGAALAYWGGDWSALAGRTITLTDEPSVPCDGVPGATGCYDGNVRVTTVDPDTGTYACVEQTVLVHEIGHAVLGDRLHDDPRWMEFEPVQAALAGRVGYEPSGEVDCAIYVSVWRHPLGTR